MAPLRMVNFLKARREALGLSLDAVGAAAGTTRQQVHKLENKKTISVEWAKKLAPALQTTWPALLGLDVSPAQPTDTLTTIPGLPEMTPLLAGVAEIDVLAGLGSGGDGAAQAFTLGPSDTVSGDAVRQLWGIPDSYLEGELGMRRRNLRIIEVRGDSMEPTLRSTDRVMINLADRIPSPDGIFAFFDGYGVSVKRMEIIPRSDPPQVLAISDNQKHSPKSYAFDEINIIGRIIWVARRL